MNRNELLINEVSDAPPSMLQEVTINEILNKTSGNNVPIIENMQQPHIQPQYGHQMNGQYIAPPPQLSVNMGNILDPALGVELIDMIFPALAVILFGQMGVNIKKTQLQATAKEKEAMLRPTQAIMSELNIETSNPWVAFGVTMLGVYGSKCAVLVAEEISNRADRKNTGAIEFDANGTAIKRRGGGRPAGAKNKPKS